MGKNSIKIFLMTLLTIVSLGGVFLGTFAWFQNKVTIGNIGGTGDTESAYFAYGDGTPDHPFGIKTTRHLNNLAWLQYAGTFKTAGVHFELANDINGGTVKNPFVMPPIGTEENPFIGVFNGNGHTISNVKISNNDATFSNKPSKITYNSAKAEVVGFFGVIGDLDEDVKYSSSINTVTNLKLDNITVHSETTNTLIGLAAGFVNADISDIKVGKSVIDVKGCKPIKSITNNLSDYSLVGYSSSTSTVSDFTKKISENYHKKIDGTEIGGFDSSIDFHELNNYFWDLHKTKSYDTGSKSDDVGYFIHTGGSSTSSKRYNQKTGTNYSEIYNSVQYTSGSPYALLCNVQTNPYSVLSYEINIDENGNLTGVYGQTKKTDPAYCGSMRHYFTATQGKTNTNYIYFDINFEDTFTYATGKTLNKLTLVSSAAQTSSSIYLSFGAFEYGTRTYVAKNRLNTNFFTWYFSSIYRMQTGTYLPISFGNSELSHTTVTNKNTGYIIGKSASANMYGNGSPKIAAYDKEKYLNNSLTNGVIKSNGIKYYNSSSGTWATITDTKVDGNVTSSSPSFERYISPRNELTKSIDKTNRVHGIHFDYYSNGSSDLGTDKCQTGTMITNYSQTAKANYKMPLGSIDFYLEKPGYITFFAGTYTETANVPINFFSLYKIERPSNNGNVDFTSISSINEISKIYKTTTFDSENPTYIYQYVGEEEEDIAEHGALVYDLSCLWTEKDNSDHSLYYFEIPIGMGEFAMGAVSSTHSPTSDVQGAYMMYLDLGANGKKSGDVIMDAHYVETTTNSDSFPAGVDYNISNLTVVGGSTTCIAITYSDIEAMASTVTGSVTFNPTSVVVVDSTIVGCGCRYDAGNILDDSSSTKTIGDLSGSGGGTRVLVADITDSDNSRWTIEYTRILDNEGEVTSSSYTKIIKGSTDMTASGESVVPAIFKNNISNIESSIVAVQLDFEGTDFNITNVTYEGTKVSLTIPSEEIAGIDLDVTFGTHYSSLYINGSLYPTS